MPAPSVASDTSKVSCQPCPCDALDRGSLINPVSQPIFCLLCPVQKLPWNVNTCWVYQEVHTERSLPIQKHAVSDYFLRQLNSIRPVTSYINKVCFNITLTFAPRSPSWFLLLRCLTKILCLFFFSPSMLTFNPYHSLWFNQKMRTIQERRKLYNPLIW
jgi:hypothetical protein